MTDKKKQGSPAYAPLPPRYYIFGNYDVWDKAQMLKYADDTHELRMQSLQAYPMKWPNRNALDDAPAAKFKVGDLVTKTKGSQWTGRVVGTYSTTLTPEGYAVESSTERGSVQIYPAAALEPVQETQEPATVPYQKLTDKIDLILSDPDTELSVGAKRALLWMRTWVSVPLYTAPQPAPAPLSDDTKRLAWMADEWTPGHEKLYDKHVLETGGVGDLDDLRTFIDKQIAAQGGKV